MHNCSKLFSCIKPVSICHSFSSLEQKENWKTYGEVLETKDVEDVDRCGSFALVDDRIDAIHQPSEKRTAKSKTKLWTLFITVSSTVINYQCFPQTPLEHPEFTTVVLISSLLTCRELWLWRHEHLRPDRCSAACVVFHYGPPKFQSIEWWERADGIRERK